MEHFKGTTKLCSNLLIASVDDKDTIWIVEQDSETLDKVVIDMDKDNAKALAQWLLKVSEDEVK